jgi:hypothetical protein
MGKWCAIIVPLVAGLEEMKRNGFHDSIKVMRECR